MNETVKKNLLIAKQSKSERLYRNFPIAKYSIALMEEKNQQIAEISLNEKTISTTNCAY
jgi:hypothetical protein